MTTDFERCILRMSSSFKMEGSSTLMQLPSLLKVCMCDTFIYGLISSTVLLLTFSVNDCVNFSVSFEAVCMYVRMYMCSCV